MSEINTIFPKRTIILPAILVLILVCGGLIYIGRKSVTPVQCPEYDMQEVDSLRAAAAMHDIDIAEAETRIQDLYAQIDTLVTYINSLPPTQTRVDNAYRRLNALPDDSIADSMLPDPLSFPAVNWPEAPMADSLGRP